MDWANKIVVIVRSISVFIERFYIRVAILLLMKKIEYIELGATLFVPATHKNLSEIICAQKYPQLKSVVIDTEDGINKEALEDALVQIQKVLYSLKRSELFVFIRPRDPQVLKQLLDYEGIEKIEGFVLPKFSLENGFEYVQLLKERAFYMMPSIEGRELFEHDKLLKLRELLLQHKSKILLIRFGLEDMLGVLGMRRKCEDNIFDIAVTSSIVGNFIAIFKSVGFAVSGGVYPCFKEKEGFIKDLKRDLYEGLFSKTIIHPDQIEPAHHVYKVTQEELQEALEITQSSEAVFAQNAKMAESSTMLPWATTIIKRAAVYGVN